MEHSNGTTSKMTSEFQPSVWGDFFISYNEQPLQKSEEWMIERVNHLKKEMCGLFEASNSMMEKMIQVDTLQHLCIDHHFKEQIGILLSSIHDSELDDKSSLHEVAVRFRLLRQDGFWVSPDVFDRFKCKDGSFNADIETDPRGLLSLYNAAHLVTPGEVTLEKAIIFARRHLDLLKSSLKSPLADQVDRSLRLPLPRTLKRVEVLYYISEYKTEEAHNPNMLELAKLDFNLLQRLHLKELKDISQWWKGLYHDVALNYSRDRLVECYFWSYAIYYEPDCSRARIMFAKIYSLLSLLDDTYDVQATLEECHKLTEAIQRWDATAVSILPEYLKKFYLKLISTYEEFSEELLPNEKYRIGYNIRSLQQFSRYYLQEAEWSHYNFMPTFKDQVQVSAMSAGPQISAVALLLGMGSEASHEAFEWAMRCTGAVWSCGEIARFMNDMASFKHPKNKKDVASSIECYMNEYSVTSKVAMTEISCLIEDAWKTTNQARLEQPTLLPVIQRVINLTMSMAFIYGDKKDVYTDGKENKRTIKRLFVKPMAL